MMWRAMCACPSAQDAEAAAAEKQAAAARAAAEKEGVAARAAAAKEAEAEAAAARGAAEKARRVPIEVGPARCCSPRHPTQFEPWLFESHSVI